MEIVRDHTESCLAYLPVVQERLRHLPFPLSERMGENGNSATASTRAVPPLHATPLPSALRSYTSPAEHLGLDEGSPAN
jgi:hypothetical protein